MISWLLSIWPRCGVIGRKRCKCIKPWGHRGKHKFPSKMARLLSLSIEKAKADKVVA